MLPHKGILENIEAVAILKKTYPDILYIVTCALHGAPESKKYLDDCIALVKKLRLENSVMFITDFLDNEESMKYLQACDVMLMTYLPSEESASGAVRFCVAAQRPLITTKQKIFDEFEDCSYQVEKNKPELVAEAVEKMLNVEKGKRYLERMKKHVEKTSWEVVCKDIYNLYMGEEGVDKYE